MEISQNRSKSEKTETRHFILVLQKRLEYCTAKSMTYSDCVIRRKAQVGRSVLNISAEEQQGGGAFKIPRSTLNC